ncbi:MAG: ethanolamine ammonia-lyase subunit EutB [Myxococcota bacterium]
MQLSATIRNIAYRFRSVREVMAKANSPKSGDQLAGIAARDNVERVAARAVLANLTLHELRQHPVIPFEQDELTRMAEEAVDERIFQKIAHLTVGEFREWLLDTNTQSAHIRAIAPALIPEHAAAVCKLMSNLDLMTVAAKTEVITRANNTLGMLGTLSSRLQPNHPTDDLEGILISTREGLAYGCGDAVIGVNPATDTPESTAEILRLLGGVVERHQIPTQCCVLSHVTVQMKALDLGCPMGLMFQSLAGSEKGNRAFGISLSLIDEAYAKMKAMSPTKGPNVMYFETGQGSELSSQAHEGADQLSLEARCYGFARRYQPFIVNTVVGFIGPEYLENGPQITRAGLEDHFMGKLLGLPMGCDACFTYHAEMSQDELESLKVLLTNAGCTYLMSLPVGDDIMLNYQSTSFHDIPSLRMLTSKRAAPEFEAWLAEREIFVAGRPGRNFGKPEVIS